MAGTDSQDRPGVGGTFGATNQNVFGTTTLPIGTWTHLAATYDRTTIRLYVDGIQVATGAQTAAVSTSNAVLDHRRRLLWRAFRRPHRRGSRLQSRADRGGDSDGYGYAGFRDTLTAVHKCSTVNGFFLASWSSRSPAGF